MNVPKRCLKELKMATVLADRSRRKKEKGIKSRQYIRLAGQPISAKLECRRKGAYPRSGRVLLKYGFAISCSEALYTLGRLTNFLEKSGNFVTLSR
ncbi:hypothetical protein AVEN_136037-1 [Araneus ventricosus]|uniref:Uncharacterized protein n=1 Tax=Araneus ventricosus TaxID=182803 RepID=A0A4Y2EW06_ARAVE|nr:hypothetical protein AVEN_136037-1 [Araneus ventricosus]